jgi:hypothetical protein
VRDIEIFPRDEIFEAMFSDARVKYGINFVFQRIVDDNGSRSRRRTISNRGGSEFFEERNVKDGMNSHCRRKVELEGDVIDFVENSERA